MGPLLVEVTRHDQHDERDVVESTHRVHAVVVASSGEVIADTGAADRTTFARSAVKPFQAAACLELLGGEAAELTDSEVAVAWASHRGEQPQLAAVRELLTRSGTAPGELTCPPEAGLADPCTVSRLTHNCSGKHALFALAGPPVDTTGDHLLDPAAPLQRHILTVLEHAVGPIRVIGVDGCGAPAVAVPLAGLARGFARLPSDDAQRRVVAAGLNHPGLVGGQERLESALLRAGIVAKPGAEGVFAAAIDLPAAGAVGLAVKADDGAGRAAAAAVVAVLGAVGTPVGWEPPPPLGGGRPAGRVRVDPGSLERFLAPVLAAETGRSGS